MRHCHIETLLLLEFRVKFVFRMRSVMTQTGNRDFSDVFPVSEKGFHRAVLLDRILPGFLENSRAIAAKEVRFLLSIFMTLQPPPDDVNQPKEPYMAIYAAAGNRCCSTINHVCKSAVFTHHDLYRWSVDDLWAGAFTFLELAPPEQKRVELLACLSSLIHHTCHLLYLS
jgi:hypothetical protein